MVNLIISGKFATNYFLETCVSTTFPVICMHICVHEYCDFHRRKFQLLNLRTTSMLPDEDMVTTTCVPGLQNSLDTSSNLHVAPVRLH